MTATVQIGQEVIEFDSPLRLTATNEWGAREFAAFHIGHQAGRGTGVYCTLYDWVNGRLVAITETLKHPIIDDEGIWIRFDRKYNVAT